MPRRAGVSPASESGQAGRPPYEKGMMGMIRVWRQAGRPPYEKVMMGMIRVWHEGDYNQ
ncbi:MAG: hypothetical protein F6J93_29670 [Oscillatoria sp. SIO1A7]|nr:hypothetical protein [Oscillatoria sp. SIO1A7]